MFVLSSIRRHTRCALVTGVQTCALPICGGAAQHDLRPPSRPAAGGLTMDFDFSSDQQALGEAIQRIVADHRALPRTGNIVEPRTFHPATGLEAALADGGFFDIAREPGFGAVEAAILVRSEEHTSELQSLMRISSAVFCLTKK